MPTLDFLFLFLVLQERGCVLVHGGAFWVLL